MSNQQTGNSQVWRIETRAVGTGAVGGFVGAIAMGLLLQFGTEMLPVLGGILGQRSLLRGWIVNVVLGVLYGAVFAAALAHPPVDSYVSSFDPSEYVFGGVVYATFVIAGTLGVVPFVAELPWASVPGEFPMVSGPGWGGLAPAFVLGVGHLVYGAILGFVYGSVGK